MNFNNDYNELNKSKTFALAAILSLVTIVAVIAVVLATNASSVKRKVDSTVSNVQEDFSMVTSSETESVSSYESTGLTVSDLDFYDMYKEDDSSAESDDSKETVVDSSENSEVSEAIPVEEELDESEDGKHTLIEYRNGETEWVAISPYLTRNDYDYTNLFNQSGVMKYYEDDLLVSRFGVDISEEQDYVDFNKVKKAGVSFVMLRAGVRGYQSGQIVEDSYFADNLKRALDAGLDVGVSFVSNAITEEEAIEEANLVIELVGDKTITYPIAYIMDYPVSDTSRIEEVKRNDKTMIARAFLNTIKDAGLKPIIYGRKEWLIKEIDLSKVIGDFDFWISMPEKDLPDYPYKFTMWQYTKKGTVDGISGVVNFDISFIDYSLK